MSLLSTYLIRTRNKNEEFAARLIVTNSKSLNNPDVGEKVPAFIYLGINLVLISTNGCAKTASEIMFTALYYFIIVLN